MGKGEIAFNEQFFPFPTMFSTVLENFLSFSSNLKLSSANSLSLEGSKICCLGKVKKFLQSKTKNDLTNCLSISKHTFEHIRSVTLCQQVYCRYSLWTQLSGEQEVDALRNQAIASIAKYVQENPKAKKEDLQKEISRQIFDFARKVEKL